MKGNSEICFESLQESHFDLIREWFNKPHVQAFYSLRNWSSDDVHKKLTPYIQGHKGVRSFIIFYQKSPVGYIQSYPIKDHPWENQDLAEDIVQEAAGFDLFIGEETLLGRGLGSQIIESFLEQHIWPYYRYCFVDPDIRNEASLHLFQKCGFHEHKQIYCQNALKQNVTLLLLIRERFKPH